MIALIYLWIALGAQFASFDAKVVGVKDGDTIVVLLEGNLQETIRLAHVDCPEKKQAFGMRAKQFASNFCFGKTVKIVETARRDRSGRMIALVYVNNQCLNQSLVSNGLAWHFKKYSKDMSYDVLEQKARAAKIGLWSDPNPIAPWDWRKIKKKK
jgi:endonuclease YncB( thermonuclease family)